MIRALGHIALIGLLTLMTQIGGLAWLLALAFHRRLIAFVLAYAALSAATLAAAPQFGRVPLPCMAVPDTRIQAQSPLWCVLHRHYVTPDLLAHADALAAHMAATFPGTRTRALDANLPFFDGFPLLPHLSHDDGAKLDIALWYDHPRDWLNSPIGYFHFDPPAKDAPQPCAGRDDLVTLRWDMGWIQPLLRDAPLDIARTGAALHWLATTPPPSGRTKVLVEPHIAHRAGLSHPAIRFQGCRAARHDDHIHVQIDPA